MGNLFLAIILIAYLFLIFKFFAQYGINSLNAVVVNYFVCVITGLLFLGEIPTISLNNDKWLKWAFLNGSLFLPTFYLMAFTVEKVNVSVSTVANKMSLLIPVLFSYFFLRKSPEKFTLINTSGIVLAFLAILFTSYKKSEASTNNKNRYRILLPIALFLLGGILDTLINFTNYTYLEGKNQGLFSLSMFMTAATTGTIVLGFRYFITGKFVTKKDVLGGIILGIPNYFSLYFLLRTLSDFNNDGAMVYPVVNIGVIVFAALVAVILFKEKLSIINMLGIFFSAVSLVLIFW